MARSKFKPITTKWVKKSGTIFSLLFYTSILYADVEDSHQSTTNPSESSLTQKKADNGSHIEEECKQAEEEAEKLLVHEAIASIKETKDALAALAHHNKEEALKAIENATGKLDILLTRYPEQALLPVDFNIIVLDVAPEELKMIRETSLLAKNAVNSERYPRGRSLLNLLRSEINISTTSLPLALYLAKLKQAARVLSEKKIDEASQILQTALNRLVLTNQTIPLPIIHAKSLIIQAEAVHKEHKDLALKLIDKASHELKRAKELGYEGKDEEYAILNKTLKELEKQIKQNKNSSFFFSSLKLKLANFLKRLKLVTKE